MYHGLGTVLVLGRSSANIRQSLQTTKQAALEAEQLPEIDDLDGWFG